MSEKITAHNLDDVVKQNKEIQDDIMQKTLIIRTSCNTMQVHSIPQLALQILGMHGLIQVPVDNQYWNGAIFVKKGIRIPVINTAIPRANQYFTAWHEIYHLLFDEVSFDHVIVEDTVEERKAEYFASLMLLGNLMPYYVQLPEMDFSEKVFHCMSVFQVPYKAVLVALYESAIQNGNESVMEAVLQNFDIQHPDLAERFRYLGLDDTLVKPSYVINLGTLPYKIKKQIEKEPDLNYHKDNADYLDNIIKGINLVTGEKDD